MSTRAIPGFLKSDPVEPGYPISERRRLRSMIGTAIPDNAPPVRVHSTDQPSADRIHAYEWLRHITAGRL